MSTTLYVSPTGSPTPDGTSQSPYGSLSDALGKLQQLRNANQLAFPATICLKNGIHHVPKTLEVSVDYPLIITGENQSETILDGGTELTSWEPVTVNGRAALRTAVRTPAWQLYCNDRPLRRAAFPKEGMYRIRESAPQGLPFNHGLQTIVLQEKTFDPSWHNPQGIELTLTHLWIEEHLPYQSFDPLNDSFTSTRHSTFLMVPENTEYRLENVREALLEPGEFYYDTTDQSVTFIPPAGYDPKRDHIYLPQVGSLLILSHSQFVTLQGLTFRHGGAYRPRVQRNLDLPGAELRNYDLKSTWADKDCGSAPQAAIQVPGSILLHHCRDCAIHHCTVTASDWYGLQIGNGCTRICLERNHLHHLGGGGIRIGGASYGASPEDLTSRVSVINNHLHDLGGTYLSACGILITHAYGNLVEHNHIHDLYYTGISAGWVWGFADSIARENRIGWNHIHDLGKGVLSDMGGIYLLGIQPGTRVYCNIISRIKRRYYGGWGIYTDEGSSHIVIENNIATDCSSEAFHQHYGRENTLRNNIFAFGGDACLALTRGNDLPCLYPGESFSNALASYGNVFISSGTPFLRAGVFDHFTIPMFLAENSIFCAPDSAEPIPIAKEKDGHMVDLDQWQQRGYDRGAVTLQNPGFTNLAERDFSFGPQSLLARLHFPLLDSSQVGILPE